MKILVIPGRQPLPGTALRPTPAARGARPLRRAADSLAHAEPAAAPLELTAARLTGTRLVHLHWVFGFVLPGGRRARRAAQCWFALVIAVIRLLGMRLVWTAHNVLPHEPVFADDRAARRRLVRASDLVIAHSRPRWTGSPPSALTRAASPSSRTARFPHRRCRRPGLTADSLPRHDRRVQGSGGPARRVRRPAAARPRHPDGGKRLPRPGPRRPAARPRLPRRPGHPAAGADTGRGTGRPVRRRRRRRPAVPARHHQRQRPARPRSRTAAAHPRRSRAGRAARRRRPPLRRRRPGADLRDHRTGRGEARPHCTRCRPPPSTTSAPTAGRRSARRPSRSWRTCDPRAASCRRRCAARCSASPPTPSTAVRPRCWPTPSGWFTSASCSGRWPPVATPSAVGWLAGVTAGVNLLATVASLGLPNTMIRHLSAAADRAPWPARRSRPSPSSAAPWRWRAWSCSPRCCPAAGPTSAETSARSCW